MGGRVINLGFFILIRGIYVKKGKKYNLYDIFWLVML